MAAQVKPLTEAQSIVQELVNDFGLTPSGIAKELGVRAMNVHNIARRHASGNNIAHRLTILREQMRVATRGPQMSGDDAPTSTLADALPSVESLFAPVREAPDPASISLNAEELTPTPAKKLTEKASDWLRAAMLGEPPASANLPSSMTAPSRKRAKGEASEQGDLIEQLVPLAALLLVASGSVLLPDPYKPCGPNNDEATAIVWPIVKRAVRELDARKKLSEATTDAIAILLAVSAYGVRAHGTYQAIHAEEVQRVRPNNRPPADAAALAASGGGRINTAQSSADAGAGTRGQNGRLPIWRERGPNANRQAGSQSDSGQAPSERRSADASIDALLAMDHAGRLRLGL